MQEEKTPAQKRAGTTVTICIGQKKFGTILLEEEFEIKPD